MAGENFNPSKALITKAEVTSFQGKKEDITALIGGFAISQSITSPSYSIVLDVVDMIGWLEGERPFGEVRGEETIDLEIQCMDLNTKVIITGQILKIDGVIPHGNHKGLIYKLHIISKTSFEAATKRVTQAFKNRTASKVAQEIFNNYYGKLGGTGNMRTEQLPLNATRGSLGLKAVYFEPSADTLSLKTIIPNLPTANALQFCANRAYSEKNKSSSFRFFETLSAYYWVTDEWLIQFGTNNSHRSKDLVFNPISSRDPADAELQIKTIENMINNKRVNDADDIMAGGYKNRAFTIDLLRGKVTDETFSYSPNEFKNMNLVDDIHTGEWIDKYTNEKNAQRFIIFKDYKEKNPGENRPKQYHTEIVSQRMKHNHHLNYVQATAKLKGRLDIEPGMIVNVKATRFSTANEKPVPNKRLSGNYLVKSTEHVMRDNILETTLQLIRYMGES